jgi:hypothetical protein
LHLISIASLASSQLTHCERRQAYQVIAIGSDSGPAPEGTMPDQKRNQQSNQNTSRGQKPGQGQQSSENDQQNLQRTQGQNQGDTGTGDSQRERSTRQPASTAHDRGIGSERRSMSDSDSNLGNDIDESESVESDLDAEDSGT